ncbi:hypothetical protein [Marinobacter adhaerens]|uniref:hypothetical protein n=1 Tax=Marinobacter adhaerens TaxID=1033846 RepID=UPI001E59E585|nr:hypothetical protein [Marinobacter adhaerens]MCD1646970.1 hypothetical protein [Marinobacter adhaerens]
MAQEALIKMEEAMTANKTKIWKSDRMKLLYGGIIIMLLTASSDYILKEGLVPGSGTIKELISWLLNLLSNNGYSFGYAILTLVAIAFVAKLVWDYVWEDRVKDFFNQHMNRFDKDLDKVNKETLSALTDTRIKINTMLSDHIAKTNKFLTENELMLAISRCDQKQLIDSLREIHVKAYGDHCKSEKGLYESTNRVISKYLRANVPHRSNHNQDIVIEACEGGEGYVKWTEDTFYELHTIAVDPDYKTPTDAPKIDHPLTYNTSAIYKKLDDLKIVMKVDDKEVITTEDNLDVDVDDSGKVIGIKSKIDEIQIEKVDNSDEWVIKIKKDIDITKPKVKVSIHEESYIKEDFFVVRRDVPTCSSTVSVTLPSHWSFEYITIPPDQGWEIIQSVPYKRKATTTDWVLPGIAMACAWRRA